MGESLEWRSSTLGFFFFLVFCVLFVCLFFLLETGSLAAYSRLILLSLPSECWENKPVSSCL